MRQSPRNNRQAVLTRIGWGEPKPARVDVVLKGVLAVGDASALGPNVVLGCEAAQEERHAVVELAVAPRPCGPPRIRRGSAGGRRTAARDAPCGDTAGGGLPLLSIK